MKRFQTKNENSKAYRFQKAESYNGLHLAYVTEKTESGEVVAGKDGFVAISGEDLLLLCEQKIIFRARIADLSMSDLLSGNGVILNGADLLSGEERTMVAYFSYYRK